MYSHLKSSIFFAAVNAPDATGEREFCDAPAGTNPVANDSPLVMVSALIQYSTPLDGEAEAYGEWYPGVFILQDR